MTRYINADELDSVVFRLNTLQDAGITRGEYKLIDSVISNFPTVDVEPKWIPCSERLPDDDRTKVVTLANGNVEAGYYSNGDWWCVGDSITLENPTVIAWMPLPKQYKPHEVE